MIMRWLTSWPGYEVSIAGLFTHTWQDVIIYLSHVVVVFVVDHMYAVDSCDKETLLHFVRDVDIFCP